MDKMDWIRCPKCSSKTRTMIREHTVLEDFYAVGTLVDELTVGFHMEAHDYLDREKVYTLQRRKNGRSCAGKGLRI